jgi:hypothetical protein
VAQSYVSQRWTCGFGLFVPSLPLISTNHKENNVLKSKWQFISTLVVLIMVGLLWGSPPF